MSGNWSFLGDIADWYDAQTNRVLVMRERAFESVDPRGLSGWNHLSSPIGLWAAWGSGLIHMSQGFVDTLRIGNGIQRGGWGYVQDGLRVLNLFDGAGRVIGRVGRVLRTVIQPPGTAICSWVSVFNSLERTNNRIFVNLRDILNSVGVTEDAINAAGGTRSTLFAQLIQRLRLFNIEVEELRLALHQSGWEQLVGHAAIRHRGVFVVAFSFASQSAGAARSVASRWHHLTATFSREYGLIFQDTNGRIYAGIQALRQVYPDATLSREFPIVFIRDSAMVTNAALVSTAGHAARAVEQSVEGASILDNIVLPAVPIVSDQAPPRE